MSSSNIISPLTRLFESESNSEGQTIESSLFNSENVDLSFQKNEYSENISIMKFYDLLFTKEILSKITEWSNQSLETTKEPFSN